MYGRIPTKEGANSSKGQRVLSHVCNGGRGPATAGLEFKSNS